MKKPKLTQSLTNLLKVARSNIRMVHTIAANNEINEVLDTYALQYWKNVQLGRDPEADIDKIMQALLKRIVAGLSVEQAKARERETAQKALRG